jgi:hypothetical protein
MGVPEMRKSRYFYEGKSLSPSALIQEKEWSIFILSNSLAI